MADVNQVQIDTPKQADAMESGANAKPVAVAAIKDDAKSKGMMVGGVLVFGGLAVGIGAGVGIGYGAFNKPAPVEQPEFASRKGPALTNICAGKKPTGDDWKNFDCMKDDVVQATEQAGADVTEGYVGGLNTTASPITQPYYFEGMCPVNVHWHLGAEHRSEGEFDEDGHGPTSDADLQHRRKLAGKVRRGLRCHHYDAKDPKYTTEYKWEHCVGMTVGETYEVHWPHSKAGACGTPNQYQTPFYDGVFCSDVAVGAVLAGQVPVEKAIGVQGQVFTIVNDERFYYPDLFRGMLVEGDFGDDIATYTGSTTGTSRNNEICSKYAPITWQVDRKCHLVSASSFDKMCADMKAQNDDMSDDLHAHGSRELVASHLTANNQGAEVENPFYPSA